MLVGMFRAFAVDFRIRGTSKIFAALCAALRFEYKYTTPDV